MRKSKLSCPVCGKHLCKHISCTFCEGIAPNECCENDIQAVFGYCTCNFDGSSLQIERIIQQQQESKRLKHTNQILHAEIQELRDALIVKNPR